MSAADERATLAGVDAVAAGFDPADMVDLLDRAGGIGWSSLTAAQKRAVVHYVRTVEQWAPDPFAGLPDPF